MNDGVTARFSGRVGNDPLVQHTRSGDLMVSFSVAVADYRTHSEGQTVRWIRTAVFAELAELLVDSLRRGTVVACEGRLVVKLYEGEPDLECYAWSVEPVPGPPAPRRRQLSTVTVQSTYDG